MTIWTNGGHPSWGRNAANPGLSSSSESLHSTASHGFRSRVSRRPTSAFSFKERGTERAKGFSSKR
jgi:hypothetical protein